MRGLCTAFPGAYIRHAAAERADAGALVVALTRTGWMAALISRACGGSGLGLAKASVIMGEINRAGGNAGACHGRVYNMGTLPRRGSGAQQRLYLPCISSGELRRQSMAVTEPGACTDTTKIKTSAVRAAVARAATAMSSPGRRCGSRTCRPPS